MGLLDFLIGQGVRTFGNVIYNNSRNIPPRGTVRPNNSRIVSDGKRWVTGLEAQKILEEERQKKITKVFNPKEGKMFAFNFAPSSTNSVVATAKTSDEKPKKVTTTTVSATPVSTTRVGGFKINDGMLPSSGLLIDEAPEVDMLRPIENPDTDSVVFKQPTRQFIQQPSTLNISAPTEGLNVQKVYNKKDTRSWLWSQGIDPYTLTGRQRRKIRNDLNTTGTTNFKINGISIAKKGSKLIKKEEVCPKCGKVHKAGIGCTIAKFKYDNGGSLNRIPFYQKGTPKDSSFQLQNEIDRYENWNQLSIDQQNAIRNAKVKNYLGYPTIPNVIKAVSAYFGGEDPKNPLQIVQKGTPPIPTLPAGYSGDLMKLGLQFAKKQGLQVIKATNGKEYVKLANGAIQSLENFGRDVSRKLYTPKVKQILDIEKEKDAAKLAERFGKISYKPANVTDPATNIEATKGSINRVGRKVSNRNAVNANMIE